MSSVCPYLTICKKISCRPDIYACGLCSFLTVIDKQRQTYLKNQTDLQQIVDLEKRYVSKWNKCSASGGKGPAMGRCFEEWIRKMLEDNGKNVEKGEVQFKFGEFQVDAVIPSRKNPQTILEIKMGIDVQDALMIRGLFDQLINPNNKIGLVTFYDFTVRRPQTRGIFKDWKMRFQNRFDCFHIENGWSTEIARLINFC